MASSHSGSAAPPEEGEEREGHSGALPPSDRSILDELMADPGDFKHQDLDDLEDNNNGEEASKQKRRLLKTGHHDKKTTKDSSSAEGHGKIPSDNGKKAIPKASEKTAVGNEHEIPQEPANGQVINTASTMKKLLDVKKPNVTPIIRQKKTHRVRYFIIKSLNHHNIAKSIENGIWATQQMNEPILNEAFETSEQVILIFSVNMSGHFQGYARMASPIGQRRANVWNEVAEGANPWGGTFSVDWLHLFDLPFQMTIQLKNPLNFYKPVKISRDGQELTAEVGAALCALIDEGAGDIDGTKRKFDTLVPIPEVSAKRPREGQPVQLMDLMQSYPRPVTSPAQSRFPLGGTDVHYETEYGTAYGIEYGTEFGTEYDPVVVRQIANRHNGFAHGYGTDDLHFSGPIPQVSPHISGRYLELSLSQRSRGPMFGQPPLAKRQWEPESGGGGGGEVGETPEVREKRRQGGVSRPQKKVALPEEELLKMTYEEYLERIGGGRALPVSDQEPGLWQASQDPGFGGEWGPGSSGRHFTEEGSRQWWNKTKGDAELPMDTSLMGRSRIQDSSQVTPHIHGGRGRERERERGLNREWGRGFSSGFEERCSPRVKD